MTMGLKVRELLNEKKIKDKAKTRKEESDAILDNIYSLLLEKKPNKKGVPKKMN